MNFRLLKNRNFALFVGGQALSMFGTLFSNVALSLYILSITGSASKFSMVLTLGVIPQVLAGLFAGVVVDRVDRRKLIIFLDLFRGVYLLGLVAYATAYSLNEWMIYVTVFLFGLIDLFFGPAYMTILPSIVRDDELVDANALQSTIMETTRLAGPVAGAFVYATSGIHTTLFLDGISFFVAMLAMIFMVFSGKIPSSGKKLTIYQDVVIGVESVFRRDKRITSLVMNGMLTHIFLHPFVLVGVPYILVRILGGSEVQFGTVQTMITVGSLLAIFPVSMIKKRFNLSQSIGIGVLAMFVAVLPYFALANEGFLGFLGGNSLYAVMFFSAVSFAAYFSFSTYIVFFVTFYQRVIPQEMLGRFMSVSTLIYALGRLIGFQMYGYLFDHVSLGWIMLILAAGMFLKIVVHMPFMKYDRLANQVGEGKVVGV